MRIRGRLWTHISDYILPRDETQHGAKGSLGKDGHFADHTVSRNQHAGSKPAGSDPGGGRARPVTGTILEG